jgi:hypothetical protein
LLVAAALLMVVPPAKAQSPCPAGTEDMLTWFTMDAKMRANQHLEGNVNPMYTQVWAPDASGLGKFFWVKSAKGYPWDVHLYDDDFIYDWLTESSWSDPQTYKRFVNNRTLPLSPRCVQPGDGTTPNATIMIANTVYEAHTSCSQYAYKNLKKSMNQVFGPRAMSFGGDLPDNIPTMTAVYQYNCDDHYQTCGDKEEYYLAKPYGLVEWRHYVLQGSEYRIDNSTTFNRLTAGQTKAALPCFDQH